MQFTASYSDVLPNELGQTDTNANGFYFGILAFLHVRPFRLKRLPSGASPKNIGPCFGLIYVCLSNG